MTINFLVIGGSGHWSELNHYPALLALENEDISARVVGICDPTDPYSVDATHYKVGKKNLALILERDAPIWINPKQFQSQHELTAYLERIVREHDVTIVIVATNPAEHYFYAQWAVEQSLNVLCDKPLIVVPDASWKPEKAEEIERRFSSLLRKVTENQRVNPNYSFCTPLRRRALTPFVKIADSLHQVYEQTGQGITYINSMVNGGIHRYPVEFTKGGAHGFLDGVGSLSHTSYHYLDVLAWYLQSAPGNVKRIGVSAVYVNRVKDYLAAQGYKPLMLLNREDPATVAGKANLPQSVLNAELDFTLHFTLYDQTDIRLGLLTYTYSQTSYSPRTNKYEPSMLDHANHKEGGRMSQIYYDIHQGPLQNWLLIKNDVVFEENRIAITQRKHPRLGPSYKHEEYKDAYDKQTATPADLFVCFVKKCVGLPVSADHLAQLQFIEDQGLSHRIFSASYEQIARQYVDPHIRDEISIPLD